jgi:hypothetical protein
MTPDCTQEMKGGKTEGEIVNFLDVPGKPHILPPKTYSLILDLFLKHLFQCKCITAECGKPNQASQISCQRNSKVQVADSLG